MGFKASVFVFDGIPSETFGVEMVRFNTGQVVSTVASAAEPVTGKPIHGFRSVLYGGKQSKDLTLSFTIGVGRPKDGWTYRNGNVALNRYEVEAISNWLTDKPDTWKWLEVCQPDLEGVRYRCVVTGLRRVDFGNYPIAFEVEAQCDSPFAYTFPQTSVYECASEMNVVLVNERSAVERYSPIVEVTPNRARDITIRNETLSTETRMTVSPLTIGVPITIDGETGIVRAASPDVPNVYQLFNFEFLPLARGRNELRISGDCTVRIICAYPVNVGG